MIKIKTLKLFVLRFLFRLLWIAHQMGDASIKKKDANQSDDDAGIVSTDETSKVFYNISECIYLKSPIGIADGDKQQIDAE